MKTQGRRIALLSISPDLAQGDSLQIFPSYGIRRIQAAIVGDPALADAEVRLIDQRLHDVEGFVTEVTDFQPDVIGVSIYIWSMKTMAEVIRRIRRSLPLCTIVVGGPSARPEVFDLAPYRDVRPMIDAVIPADGEETFRELVALRDRSPQSLTAIPGLALWNQLGWFRTAARTPNPNLDTVSSPFQLGLMPRDQVAYMETFRGCPLSCKFCQWGVMDSKRRFSKEYLVRELRAFQEVDPRFVYLVDAALNLNPAAFRNLIAAEREVRFFENVPLICEVYPNMLNRDHIEFLERTKHVHVGLGVQSLDEQALDAVDRPFKKEHLRPVIEQLSKYGLVDVELILGLPGDTPASFRQTVEEALELPCSVRIFRCLILPDALMTRAPKEYNIRFDPETLVMKSCFTWSERDIEETQEWVAGLSRTGPRTSGEYWWHFRSDLPGYRTAYGVA